MRRLAFSLLFLFLIQLPVQAQQEKSYFLDLPAKVRSGELFAGQHQGDVEALAIAEYGKINFYRKVITLFEPLQEVSLEAPALEIDGFVSNGSYFGFYGMETTQGSHPLRYVSYTFGKSGVGLVQKQEYALTGKNQLSFITEHEAFLLDYTYKSGELQVSRFRPGRKQPEAVSFQIPKEIKLKRKLFKSLRYRNTASLANPGVLAAKNHIFVEGNTLYLFLKNGKTGNLELLMLNLDDQSVQRRTMASAAIASQVNIYIHQAHLYYYHLSANFLEVTRYNLRTWESEKVLTISKNDETLPTLVVRKDREKFFTTIFSRNTLKRSEKEVSSKKLLAMLRVHEPYIYVQSDPQSPKAIQLVLGSYSIASAGYPGGMVPSFGPGGTMTYHMSPGWGGSSEANTYVLIGYNEDTQAIHTLQNPWKNPETVWEELEDQLRDDKSTKPIAEWVYNLGTEMLVVYFDKKQQLVKEWRVPMFDEVPAAQGTN